MPQKPMVRAKQKRRRTKQLAAWRAENEQQTQPAGEKAPPKAEKK